MSAPKCGRSAAIWGEIGLQERLVGRILSSSKTACINSRWAAVVQTFPRRVIAQSNADSERRFAATFFDSSTQTAQHFR